MGQPILLGPRGRTEREKKNMTNRARKFHRSWGGMFKKVPLLVPQHILEQMPLRRERRRPRGVERARVCKTVLGNLRGSEGKEGACHGR